MTLLLTFPGTSDAPADHVGGKAGSLIRMAGAGYRVPPGAVLTTKFFAPWFAEIQASHAWRAFRDAEPAQWPERSAAIQSLVAGLDWTKAQRRALADLEDSLPREGASDRFAVRSSAPDEDMSSASFAGGYATRLGVPSGELEAAIRHCCASALDARVFAYKREKRLDVYAPRIAVVVQQQLASEVAGVGFSLNPLTNDHDEAVIDASWGLGEPVVSGRVSPDHWVVDKFTREVLEQKPGAKQLVVVLAEGGGVRETAREPTEEPSLTGAQVAELVALMVRLEDLFDVPVDVEWAYAEGLLHVLQARPITTYVPLPETMMTQPGEPRRLYLDGGLASGFTSNEPISPLGLDVIRALLVELAATYTGPAKRPPPNDDSIDYFNAVLLLTGGRFYIDLSRTLWTTSPQLLALKLEPTDPVAAAILADVDVERYRTGRRPRWARLRMLREMPGILWRARGFLRAVLWGFVAPERAWHAYRRRVAEYERMIADAENADVSLETLQRRYLADVVRRGFEAPFAALGSGVAAAQGGIHRIMRGRSGGDRALADQLQRGFQGNLVVEMGLAMARLSTRLIRSDLDDLDALLRRIEARDMPDAFLAEWDSFLARFGCRGPGEMDVARPRYADAPNMTLQQVAGMRGDGEGFDPAAAHARQVEARHRAFETLYPQLGWVRRRLLRRCHRVAGRFAGERDTPKHHLLMYLHLVRRSALDGGERLVRAGRLDAAEHVFDLTFADLEAAADDPSLDLRERREERTRFIRRLECQVTHFPRAIDSRGRILRPPLRAERDGELKGVAISPGSATGPVKVLASPDEKPVNEGDVLVAYTTDPGWTPLFANAAAIVLEVGGVLQHGAIVAREYGKPCVAGIDRVTIKLRDGQRVEVDGSSGVIRLLSGDDSSDVLA